MSTYHKAVERMDAVRVRINNPYGIPITLFSSEEIAIESSAVDEVLALASVDSSIRVMRPDARVEEIALTPDFHKGAGIPIGTVIRTTNAVLPQAPGNDIGCGMRLLVTDVRRDEVEHVADAVQGRLREVFFEGRRDIPMSPSQRRATLLHGLDGLSRQSTENAGNGLWSLFDKDQVEHAHAGGAFISKSVLPLLEPYVTGSGTSNSRDAQIGSIGGGNHFVEIQSVEEVLDGGTARSWGVSHGRVAIMAHSGSVGLGHVVGGYFTDKAKAAWPKSFARPEHGFYGIVDESAMRDYQDALHNAANFAFANRLFLGLMVIRAMSDVLGRVVKHRVIYDAPHNFVWRTNGQTFVHRKGACPAGSPLEDYGSGAGYGEPVIVPGSMGDSSYLLRGLGHEGSMQSACHGAGRVVARGASRHFAKDSLAKIRVVTPVNPMELKKRPDIAAAHEARLLEESPAAYRPVAPVVETIRQAGIAELVARLSPIMTIKG